MSATEAVRKWRESYTPDPEQSVDQIARFMFEMQCEIYSAHAGGDLFGPDAWDYLPPATLDSWIEAAERRIAEVADDG